jgi:hypothetical protein
VRGNGGVPIPQAQLVVLEGAAMPPAAGDIEAAARAVDGEAIRRSASSSAESGGSSTTSGG